MYLLTISEQCVTNVEPLFFMVSFFNRYIGPLNRVRIFFKCLSYGVDPLCQSEYGTVMPNLIAIGEYNLVKYLVDNFNMDVQ